MRFQQGFEKMFGQVPHNRDDDAVAREVIRFVVLFGQSIVVR
jgi:hypothetical protein